MKDRRVIKLKRDININVATIIVLAVVLYVLISVFRASRKEPIATYKVNKSNVSNNIMVEGISVRDEKILYTNNSGYACYYIRDGEKIKNGATVCTVDQTGRLQELIVNNENYNDVLSDEDYNDIRSVISLYKIKYDNVDFYDSYNFENNINNKVLELNNELIMQQINQSSMTGSLSSVNSPYSGIVTYYTDGYEDISLSGISAADFDKSSYSKQTLKSGDIVEANAPVVKIIPSENWKIVAPITEEQIALISAEDHINFKINNSSYNIYMPYEIINGTDGKYLCIKLDKYLSNFISERFVNIEIILDDDTGLKVPVSALVDKKVYKIPKYYFSAGGNQTQSNKINIQVRNEDTGEITLKQVTPTIYITDEAFCYADPLAFQPTDVIIDIESNNTMAVSLIEMESIKGVYTSNRGIAEFRKVSIIKTVDEFALISGDEELKIYDNIILDSSKVSENQILY